MQAYKRKLRGKKRMIIVSQRETIKGSALACLEDILLFFAQDSFPLKETMVFSPQKGEGKPSCAKKRRNPFKHASAVKIEEKASRDTKIEYFCVPCWFLYAPLFIPSSFKIEDFNQATKCA